MKCKELFEIIDGLQEKYLSVWEDVCNIESPTEDKSGVDAVGDYFADMAKTRGFRVERARQAVSGDVVCITANATSEAAPITLSGHMDTVYPKGAFGTPAVRREGDRLFGPGVTDCKGGIVAAFLAMDALDRCGFRDRPIQLLLQSDEETGSRQSQKKTVRYICEKAKSSIAFFNMERHTAEEACLERKGILSFTFTVNGVEAHASACGIRGANAILEAAHKIIEIEKIKDSAGLTCCCSLVTGGTAVNTVPGQCVFSVNARFATAAQEAWVRDCMREIAERVYVNGCRTTVKISSHRVAMERSRKNAALLETVNASLAACGLPSLAASARAGGSDAADVTAYGIPCLDSMGVRGEGIHTLGEFAYIESLAEAAKRLVCAIVGMRK